MLPMSIPSFLPRPAGCWPAFAISRKEGKIMTRHKRLTDYPVVSRGVELLRQGTLARDLSDRLSIEFGLPPERAGELADRAIDLYEKPAKPAKPTG